MNPKVQILISCMYQTDESLLQKNHVCCNAVVINQCDRNGRRDVTAVDGSRVVWIDSTARGVSKNRNQALRTATADICLFADDDIVFRDDTAAKVQQAFDEHADADVLLFQIKNIATKFPSYAKRAGYVDAMRMVSSQIAFRLRSVVTKNIAFDELMGSGTEHGGGEENKFLFDCLRHGLKIVCVPVEVATLRQGSDSQWFKGYTSDFFYWKGWASRRLLGFFLSLLYTFYFCLSKKSMYAGELPVANAFASMMKGVLHVGLKDKF